MVQGDFRDGSEEETYSIEDTESHSYYEEDSDFQGEHSSSYTQAHSEGASRRFVFPETSEEDEESEKYIYSPELLEIPHSQFSNNQGSRNSQIETKSKATENTSFGTVVRHETPQMKQSLHIKDHTPLSKRPQSARTHSKSTTSRGTRELDSVQHDSCYGLLKSIHNYLLVKQTDHPQVELGDEDHEEIEDYLHKKIQDFHSASFMHSDRKELTPFQVSKRERLKDQNKRKARKSEDILRKKQQEEIERKKKASEMFQDDCKFKLQRNLNKVLDKYHKTKAIEDYRYSKEISQVKNKEKELIKANIQNHYNSRINLLKEQLEQEKFLRKIVAYDRKKVITNQTLAEAERERKRIRKQHLEDAMKLIDKERKEFLLSLQEAEKFEEKIIKLYKKAR
jgi:hypothetical protein